MNKSTTTLKEAIGDQLDGFAFARLKDKKLATGEILGLFADFLQSIELPKYSADSDRAVDDWKYKHSARYSEYDLAIHKDELLSEVKGTFNRIVEELKS